MQLHHYKFTRITVDPAKCFGKPCVRDLRMPVSSILGYMSSGMSVGEIIEQWPELEAEDVYQALGYAALEAEEEIFLPRSDAAA